MCLLLCDMALERRFAVECSDDTIVKRPTNHNNSRFDVLLYDIEEQKNMQRFIVHHISRKYRPAWSIAAGATAVVCGACMGSSSVRAEEENNKDSSTTGDEAAATRVPWKRMWKAAAEDSPFLQGIDAALPDRLSQILNGGGSQQRDLSLIHI